MSTLIKNTKQDSTIVNELLFKLERNHTEIQTLLGKLSSYTCEPTNYECFERLRDLRDEIDTLKTTNLELFRTIDLKKLNHEQDLIKTIRNQIASFKELDRKIGMYLIDTKGY